VNPARCGSSSTFFTTNPDCFNLLSTLHAAHKPLCSHAFSVAGDGIGVAIAGSSLEDPEVESELDGLSPLQEARIPNSSSLRS
jgi:hypothetical protein